MICFPPCPFDPARSLQRRPDYQGHMCLDFAIPFFASWSVVARWHCQHLVMPCVALVICRSDTPSLSYIIVFQFPFPFNAYSCDSVRGAIQSQAIPLDISHYLFTLWVFNCYGCCGWDCCCGNRQKIFCPMGKQGGRESMRLEVFSSGFIPKLVLAQLSLS